MVRDTLFFHILCETSNKARSCHHPCLELCHGFADEASLTTKTRRASRRRGEKAFAKTTDAAATTTTTTAAILRLCSSPERCDAIRSAAGAGPLCASLWRRSRRLLWRNNLALERFFLVDVVLAHSLSVQWGLFAAGDRTLLYLGTVRVASPTLLRTFCAAWCLAFFAFGSVGAAIPIGFDAFGAPWMLTGFTLSFGFLFCRDFGCACACWG